MPNGAPFREWKQQGRRTVIVAWGVLGIETAFLPLLTVLWGVVGVAVSLFMLNVTLLVTVVTMQRQIDAIDGALRGMKDESDYSDRILAHLRRELASPWEKAGP